MCSDVAVCAVGCGIFLGGGWFCSFALIFPVWGQFLQHKWPWETKNCFVFPDVVGNWERILNQENITRPVLRKSGLDAKPGETVVDHTAVAPSQDCH